jgi:hypothetical protein
MTLKEMLPELNHNQLKMLKHIIMDGLPKKIDEGDGWDIYFESSDKVRMGKNGKTRVVEKGKVRSCCPGDDIAYVQNKTVDDLTTAIEKVFDDIK